MRKESSARARRVSATCITDVYPVRHTREGIWSSRGCSLALNRHAEWSGMCPPWTNCTCFCFSKLGMSTGPCEQTDPTTAQWFRTNPTTAQRSTAIPFANPLDLAVGATVPTKQKPRKHMHILSTYLVTWFCCNTKSLQIKKEVVSSRMRESLVHASSE